MSFGALAFGAPWVLLALLVLPVLWLLLRAIPPAPIRRRFPGVALMLGLTDEDRQADKTPWWLLVLRILAVAAAIVAFAGPVLNPAPKVAGSAPLLIVIDGGWAEAQDWTKRLDRAAALVAEAGRDGRPVAVLRLTDPATAVQFQAADASAGRLNALKPAPWLPGAMSDWAAVLPAGGYDTFWMSDGLDHPGREDLRAALATHGDIRIYQSDAVIFALHPARFDAGAVQLAVSRLNGVAEQRVEIIAKGPDPAGIDRELARAPLDFQAGAARGETALTLPPELRNRITRFEILGQRNAGAISLTDDSLKRRKVALVGDGADKEGLQLLSATHYLHQALAPMAELLDGDITDILPANPDVIVLADVARLTQSENDGLLDWVNKGGLLLRFAGPKLAASDLARGDLDPLLPVRLREGGRTVGGAMSWDDPKGLAPFPDDSPFHGLEIPADVSVTSQVLAQPDPDLGARTIAALADGTPLVTRRVIGQGQVVLFHVTANAEWSSLPLSGLFVQMLERLAVSTRPALPQLADLAGQVWVPERVIDAFGQAAKADALAGVEGAVLASALTNGPDTVTPPGLYAGADRRVALNAVGEATPLVAAHWPPGTAIEGLESAAEHSLKGPLLALALVGLALDILAALLVSGRLAGIGRGAAVVLVLLVATGDRGQAQVVADAVQPGDARAIAATEGVVLAYVTSGDAAVDAVSEAGLRGLGDQLWNRTAVEPLAPMAVDIETDELGFFPFLYWPIVAGAPLPSAQATAKLNRFLRTGGMILFDTRDGDLAGVGGTSPEAQELQAIAAGLDIPAIEPIPSDHVLTRSFYLLQTFPGRFGEGTIWVEAAPPDAAKDEGMPFRNLNDGVTPVVVGGNDWAAAWATDADGMAMFPVGRGYAGEQQREYAYRFGINLLMYVLTGNYKSDQVHVPALLERLGK